MASAKQHDAPEKPGAWARVRGLFTGRGRWVLPAVAAAALIGGGLALVAGQRELARRASEVRSRPGPVELRIEWPLLATIDGGPPQTWMSRQWQARLEAIARAELNSDPLDRASLRAASKALFETGWLAHEPEVRRGPMGVVTIRGQWHDPVAVVRYGQRDYVISADAHRLPLDYPVGESNLRFLANPFSPPPLKPGEKWIGGDIEAGLALLALVQPYGTTYDQVAGVDLQGYTSTKSLTLLTDRGGRVVWGAAPGEWNPGEPPMERKLNWLVSLRGDDKFGRRIDAGMPLIRLTNPRGVIFENTITQDPPPPAGARPTAPGAPTGPRSAGVPAPRVAESARRQRGSASPDASAPTPASGAPARAAAEPRRNGRN